MTEPEQQTTTRTVAELLKTVTQRVALLHVVWELGNADNEEAAACFVKLAREFLPSVARDLADVTTMFAENLASYGLRDAHAWFGSESEELRRLAILFGWVKEGALRIDEALRQCRSPQTTMNTVLDVLELVTYQVAFLDCVWEARNAGEAVNPVAEAYFVELSGKLLPSVAEDLADVTTMFAESLASYGPQGEHAWSDSDHQALRRFTTVFRWVAEEALSVQEVLRECESPIA
ncbi:hypothetical protein ACRYCC_29545 [Actinomadura scrupuli]|uniref:hypothetical protein n=1 Tax=Actinomadura scrupuli TaxID=559629 RepID=UPI003D959B23